MCFYVETCEFKVCVPNVGSDILPMELSPPITENYCLHDKFCEIAEMLKILETFTFERQIQIPKLP